VGKALHPEFAQVYLVRHEGKRVFTKTNLMRNEKRFKTILCVLALCVPLAGNNAANTIKLTLNFKIMANQDIYFPKMLKWAGGYVNDPADSGGATKYDVTLATWQRLGYDKDMDGDIDVEDIKLLNHADADKINEWFWNKCRANEINNQAVAESVVEAFWGSGITGIKLIQRVAGVEPDGKIGQITLDAINSHSPAELHEKIRLAKIAFVTNLANRRLKDKRFLKGWIRRINDFSYF